MAVVVFINFYEYFYGSITWASNSLFRQTQWGGGGVCLMKSFWYHEYPVEGSTPETHWFTVKHVCNDQLYNKI